MKVSANLLTWLLRFYPPLLFQRIWVLSIGKDFRSARVKISRSLLNRNYNRSIFGGTIYAATDVFYPVLFHQLFSHEDYKIIVWLKSASVQYIKPGMTNLYFDIQISEEQISAAREILDTDGKYIETFPIELYNADKELCATVASEVYIRNLNLKRQ